MRYYRLYHLQGDMYGRFDEFDAPDDATAISVASQLVGSEGGHLRYGGRLIAELPALECNVYPISRSVEDDAPISKRLL